MIRKDDAAGHTRIVQRDSLSVFVDWVDRAVEKVAVWKLLLKLRGEQRDASGVIVRDKTKKSADELGCNL